MKVITLDSELTEKQHKKCDTYQLFLAENKNVPNETLFIDLQLILCKPRGHTVTANIRHFSTGTHCKVMAPNSPHTSGVMVIEYLGTSASRLLSPFIHSGSLRDSTKIDRQKPVLSRLMIFSFLNIPTSTSSCSTTLTNLLHTNFKYRNFDTGFKRRAGCTIRHGLPRCKGLADRNIQPQARDVNHSTSVAGNMRKTW